MAYHYDKFGWFTSAQLPGRSTDVAPPTLSETTTDGEQRANWTGHAWEVLAYRAPVIDPPAVIVPAAVTMRQARLALFMAGKLADVDTAIAALPEPAKTAAQIEWEFSNELQRSNPLVLTLGPALGLTSEQIDALFIAASAL